MSKHSEGQDAELIALQFLTNRGLKPITQNYRCKAGEIDLIMRDDKTLVFVEVRLRKNANFGGAAGSITEQKRQRIIRAAEHFLLNLSKTPPCRFDAILMNGLSMDRVDWVRDAFSA